MKRVLIVGFDFPPQRASSAVRAAKLVKYLPRFGWLPTVICPDMVTRWDDSLLGDIPVGVVVWRVGGWAGRLVRVEAGAPSGLAPAGGNLGQRAVRLLRAAVRGTLKVFEYLATGHPLLAVAPEGEVAALIRQQRAGIVVHPDDREGILATIRDPLRRHLAGEG